MLKQSEQDDLFEDLCALLRYAIPAIETSAKAYPFGRWPTILEQAQETLRKAGEP